MHFHPSHSFALLTDLQVLVLGGGFDTTWFQLAQAGKLPARYLELDYPEVRLD